MVFINKIENMLFFFFAQYFEENYGKTKSIINIYANENASFIRNMAKAHQVLNENELLTSCTVHMNVLVLIILWGILNFILLNNQ